MPTRTPAQVLHLLYPIWKGLPLARIEEMFARNHLSFRRKNRGFRVKIGCVHGCGMNVPNRDSYNCPKMYGVQRP